MKTKLMIALFSTLLLGACQNSQMGMDNKDMKETTEMMSSMSGEKMDKMDNMSSKDEKMDNMSSKDEKMDKKMGEMDDMTQSTFTPKDSVILTVIAPGVNREKSLEDFKKWFDGVDYHSLPVLVDKDGQFLKKLGVVGYPTSAFIDANGKVVRVQPGHVSNDDIVKTLESL